MISVEEKNQILALVKEGKQLTNELKEKLLNSVRNGESSIFEDDDHLCCDLGIDPPNRYVWTTYENCRALGGRAADNSMCGR